MTSSDNATCPVRAADFLWFSDIALVTPLVALWTGNRLTTRHLR